MWIESSLFVQLNVTCNLMMYSFLLFFKWQEENIAVYTVILLYVVIWKPTKSLSFYLNIFVNVTPCLVSQSGLQILKAMFDRVKNNKGNYESKEILNVSGFRSGVQSGECGNGVIAHCVYTWTVLLRLCILYYCLFSRSSGDFFQEQHL